MGRLRIAITIATAATACVYKTFFEIFQVQRTVLVNSSTTTVTTTVTNTHGCDGYEVFDLWAEDSFMATTGGGKLMSENFVFRFHTMYYNIGNDLVPPTRAIYHRLPPPWARYHTSSLPTTSYWSPLSRSMTQGPGMRNRLPAFFFFRQRNKTTPFLPRAYNGLPFNESHAPTTDYFT